MVCGHPPATADAAAVSQCQMHDVSAAPHLPRQSPDQHFHQSSAVPLLLPSLACSPPLGHQPPLVAMGPHKVPACSRLAGCSTACNCQQLPHCLLTGWADAQMLHSATDTGNLSPPQTKPCHQTTPPTPGPPCDSLEAASSTPAAVHSPAPACLRAGDELRLDLYLPQDRLRLLNLCFSRLLPNSSRRGLPSEMTCLRGDLQHHKEEGNVRAC